MKACFRTFAAFTAVFLFCDLGFTEETPESTAARTWTSRVGKHTIEATYTGFQQGKVLLRKADGASAAVLVFQLSDEDQDYVAKIAEDDEEAVEALTAAMVELKKDEAGRVIQAVFPKIDGRQDTAKKTRVRQAEIELLSGLPNLQRLGLAEVLISENALDEIEQLYYLRLLDLSSTMIGNPEAKKLAELTRLESLNLSNTRITNRALSYLKELPKLRELALANTRIGDQGIAHLEEVKTLKKLNLSNVRISPKGALSLRKALPNTTMEGSGVVRR